MVFRNEGICNDEIVRRVATDGDTGLAEVAGIEFAVATGHGDAYAKA